MLSFDVFVVENFSAKMLKYDILQKNVPLCQYEVMGTGIDEILDKRSYLAEKSYFQNSHFEKIVFEKLAYEKYIFQNFLIF